MNRYELAIEDMERLRKARAALKELTAWLDDKQAAAETELAACETKPGIPLPQYRPGYGLASCGHPANEDGECGCSSWPERAPYDPTGRDDTRAEVATSPGLPDATALRGAQPPARWFTRPDTGTIQFAEV
jgi:hypothetical protein